jgi:hypothetical protein
MGTNFLTITNVPKIINFQNFDLDHALSYSLTSSIYRSGNRKG